MADFIDRLFLLFAGWSIEPEPLLASLVIVVGVGIFLHAVSLRTVPRLDGKDRFEEDLYRGIDLDLDASEHASLSSQVTVHVSPPFSRVFTVFVSVIFMYLALEVFSHIVVFKWFFIFLVVTSMPNDLLRYVKIEGYTLTSKPSMFDTHVRDLTQLVEISTFEKGELKLYFIDQKPLNINLNLTQSDILNSRLHAILAKNPSLPAQKGLVERSLSGVVKQIKERRFKSSNGNRDA